MAIRVPSGDLYAELGVMPHASSEEISAAFRARARELHPDTNPDATASERFKRVSVAYRVLSDPSERSRYDASREEWRAPAPTPTPAASRPAAAGAPRQPMLLGWQMTRKRAGWVLAAGIACLLLAAAVSAWVLAEPGTGAADQTGRTVTLWLVAAKLLVGGVVAIVLGARRLGNPLR